MLTVRCARWCWILGACLVLGASTANGDVVVMTQSGNWNSPSTWGGPPLSMGNDYIIQPYPGSVDPNVTTNSGNDTFLGGSITIQDNARLVLKLRYGATATVNGPVTLDGGTLAHGPSGNLYGAGPKEVNAHDGHLAADSLTVGGNSTMKANPVSRTFFVDAPLSGDGSLRLMREEGWGPYNWLEEFDFTSQFVFTESVDEFDGLLTVGSGAIVDLPEGAVLEGGLALLEDEYGVGQLNLDSDVALGLLLLGPDLLGDGVYGFDDFDGLGYGRFFVQGEGFVTVGLNANVPEPASLALFASVLGVGLIASRRRGK